MLYYWFKFLFYLISYYTSGKTATTEDFINPKLLDSLRWFLTLAHNFTSEECTFYKPIRLTETSSCYGGGAKDLSDAYVAGFMWALTFMHPLTWTKTVW